MRNLVMNVAEHHVAVLGQKRDIRQLSTKSARYLDSSSQVGHPAIVENGKWIHDGIDLSFEIPAN